MKKNLKYTFLFTKGNKMFSFHLDKILYDFQNPSNFVEKNGYKITYNIIDDIFKKPTNDFSIYSHKKGKVQEDAIKEYRKKYDELFYSFEYTSCIACFSKEYTVIAERDRYSNPVEIVVCAGCGLIQLQPMPTQETLHDFYSYLYTPMYRGNTSLHVENFEKSSMVDSFIKFLNKNNLLKTLPINSTIIEVGCGSGRNIHKIQFLFPEHKYIGFDLDKKYLATGKSLGLDLRAGVYFNDETVSNIDFIYYHHVFEHIFNLREELVHAKDTVKVGGYLAFAFPGILNLLTSSNGDILEVIQNAHLYYFDIDNIIELCSEYGFEYIDSNHGLQILFKKTDDDEAMILKKIKARKLIKIKRYMRHDHKIFYLNTVNKLFKINQNKDISIILDILLRNTNPYSGEVMLSMDELALLLKKRMPLLQNALALLKIINNVSIKNNKIFFEV